jgi:hypothetical protein
MPWKKIAIATTPATSTLRERGRARTTAHPLPDLRKT